MGNRAWERAKTLMTTERLLFRLLYVTLMSYKSTIVIMQLVYLDICATFKLNYSDENLGSLCLVLCFSYNVHSMWKHGTHLKATTFYYNQEPHPSRHCACKWSYNRNCKVWPATIQPITVRLILIKQPIPVRLIRTNPHQRSVKRVTVFIPLRILSANCKTSESSWKLLQSCCDVSRKHSFSQSKVFWPLI